MGNSSDIMLMTRTLTVEQECNDLMASSRWPSTPYSCKTSQTYSRNLDVCIFEIDKTSVDITTPVVFVHIMEEMKKK